METNVKGTYLMCREVAKVMMIQKSGRIIAVSSMAVGLHAEGTSAYAASKSAVVEMTKILAKEVARFGITCNVIAPSIILTESVKALGDKVTERALSQLTIKREVTMSEINNVVDFFVAPESQIITGQVVHMGLVV
jgi:3-oxoacyl-[acyl-carrier protein] reductase